MDDGPYWVILLKYGSHDMRHTDFRRLTVVNGTPGFWGVTTGFIGGSFWAIGDRKTGSLEVLSWSNGG